MSKMDKLREIIRELVRKELAEATTTGDIAGYETPHAFTGGPGKGKKKKKEISTNSTGYNVVKEDVGYIGIDTKPHKKLDGSRFAVEGRLGELRKWTNALNSTLDKETKSKKYSKMIQASFKKDVGNFAKTVSKVITVAGKSIKESVNEGKYHDYRNDDTLTSKQKIGRSMREVRDSLLHLEGLVKMNVKLKNELNVDSRSYWKNTHKALNKISERLVKLANKVGQLQ